ncbi:MAG: hypothetical protein QOF85_1971 [Solirubrobacterales bacterium]|jgi:hypothetical protein|nr:hypothetical protein [Solirubrobacterales bacterium]
MRLSAAATVGILLSLVLILSSCGEDGTTAAGGTASTANTSGDPSTSGNAPSQTKPAGNPCRRQLRGFIDAMGRLRDDLARGLSYDDYLREVQSTRTVYARIRAGKLTAPCLVASGGPSERAFNLYIDAANAWGDCLATVTCSTRSVEPKLQHKWALASHQLAVAERGLRVVSRG